MNAFLLGLLVGIPVGAVLLLVVFRDDGQWPVIVDRWWLGSSERWEWIRHQELKRNSERAYI